MLLLANQSNSNSSILVTVLIALISGVTASLLTGIFTLISSSKARATETKIARMKTVSELVYENEIENLSELKKYTVRLANDIHEYTYRPSDPVELMKIVGDPKKYNQRIKVLARNIQEDIAMIDFSLSVTTNNKFKDEVFSNADELLKIAKTILAIDDDKEKAYLEQIKLKEKNRKFLASVNNYVDEQLRLLPAMINSFK